MLRNINYYGDNKKLVALSTRLSMYVLDYGKASSYLDSKILTEDLQYNIANLITEIILQLQYPITTKEEIEEVIKDFNVINQTEFNFEYFFRKGWLRLINDEFKIPGIISSHLFQISNDLSPNKPET